MQKPISTKILPLGGYYPMDKQGRVLNRASLEQVSDPWKSLLTKVVRIYQKNLGPQLHSVWLRGSVPAGTAVEYVSDLDTFALLHWQNGQEFQQWNTPEWASAEEDNLLAEFEFVSQVEFVCSSWDQENIYRYPALRALLSTQSVVVFGKTPDWGSSPHLGDLKRNAAWIESDWRALADNPSDTKAVRTFVKTFIRGVFELYMEELGQYATDFYPCLMGIHHFHPEWRDSLEEMVQIYVSPSGKGERLKILGATLMEELGEFNAE